MLTKAEQKTKGGINFNLSPEQLATQESTREFAQKVLLPVRDKVDAAPNDWEAFLAGREAYREFARAGFARSFIPTEYGGGGSSMLDFAISSEELAAVEVNIPTTVLGNGLALNPVITFGTDQQKRQFLTPFVEDTEGDLLGAYAFTEVDGGANFDSDDPRAGVKTIAKLEGDEWVINGQKHYTVNGTGWDKRGAHLFAVVCRTDPNNGARESLAIIMVPGNTPGIKILDVYDKMGARPIVAPRVHFENVRVPRANIIGKPGDGIQMVSVAFSWTAALIGAAAVGLMRAAFDEALEAALTDKRGGSQPFIVHQGPAYLLADIKMRLEACRYLSWKACQYFEETGGLAEELAIMAKVYCSETAVQAVYDAMRVKGINSYIKQFSRMDLLMRNALVMPLYDGGNVGIRRRQLQQIFMQPGYNSMLAVRSEMPPWLKR